MQTRTNISDKGISLSLVMFLLICLAGSSFMAGTYFTIGEPRSITNLEDAKVYNVLGVAEHKNGCVGIVEHTTGNPTYMYLPHGTTVGKYICEVDKGKRKLVKWK